MKKLLFLLPFFLLFFSITPQAFAEYEDTIVILETDSGRLIIEFFPDERESSLFKYYFTDDNRIGWWARENNFEVVYHTPSLSQHIGHTSSCWDSQPTSVWRRSASDFVGEEFDLLDLMNPVG